MDIIKALSVQIENSKFYPDSVIISLYKKYPRKKKKQISFMKLENGEKLPIMQRKKPYRRITRSEKLRIENAFKKQYGI